MTYLRGLEVSELEEGDMPMNNVKYKIIDNFLSMFQKALGHSSLAISLTYLRGHEVSDMPMNNVK